MQTKIMGAVFEKQSVLQIRNSENVTLVTVAFMHFAK